MDSMNPKKLLKRGYSITTKNGKILYKANALKKGDKINIILSKGKINANVEEISERK